jgi:hypothetical protein
MSSAWSSAGPSVNLTDASAAQRRRTAATIRSASAVPTFVGEADALHGQVQPFGRHEVQARQLGQAGLVVAHHPA